MKRLRFIPACLILLLSSCNEKEIDQTVPDEGQMATLRIDLSANLNEEVPEVKSDGVETISEDDFWIELFDSKKRRFYCKQYGEAKNEILNVNTGNYHLLAKHGDSLGIGFDKPFYMAEVDFTVEQKAENTVSAVAALANVKVKVVFKDDIQNTNFYGDCYAVLKNTRYKKTIRFNKGETRAGYIPGGELALYIYVMYDGQLKYYPLEPKHYDPRDFVTFTVDADERYGDLKVTIQTDDTLNETEEEIKIPAVEALPAAHPEITVSDFDENNDCQVVEGDETFPSDLQLAARTQDPMTSVIVEVESEALDVPASFDLMNLDDRTKKKLEDAGFVWFFTSTNTAAVLDFENIARHIAWNMPYDGSEETKVSNFRMTVTDALGHTDQESVTITWNLGSKSTVVIQENNVWATEIFEPAAVFSVGKPEDTTLEYSQDGINWKKLGKPVSINGNTAVYKTATGLRGGVECKFRVVYKKNFIRGEGAVMTEAQQQLGNGDFEDWTTRQFSYQTKLLTTSNEKRDWYLPWGNSDDAWWDVNSKKTMPSLTTPSGQEYKIVPTVYYSSDIAADSEGSYCAQLLSTYICNLASADSPAGDLYGYVVDKEMATAAGEIFIGSANDDGSHKTEGHAFISRPKSLSLRYRYLRYENDSFHIYMDIKDADGSIIASKEYKGSSDSGIWEELTLDFDYETLEKKAASIYMCIRSSSKADSAIEYRKLVFSDINASVAGGYEAGYIGSILYIDDMKLNY